MPEILEDRAIITLAGPERKSLLQGIVTNNMDRLENGKALYSALLTPQGKFLYDFFLFENDDVVYLDCQVEAADDLLRKLMMYRLRSDVDIQRNNDIAIVASEQKLNEEGLSYLDPRHSQMGYRAIVECSAYQGSEKTYHKRRISLGIPEGTYDFIQEKSTIHEGHFEDINGVDFEKGCYVGQEVIARMKYRGKIKKAMFPVTLADDAPAFGSDITDEKGNKIGDLRSHCGKKAIALFRTANLLFGTDYDCCGIKVTPYKPDFYKEISDD